MQLLLAKALLDRSNASKAMPVLETLLRSGSLSPRDLAEATRLVSNAEFLFGEVPKSLRVAAAKTALEAARKTDDVELVLKALLEYARTSKNLGTTRGAPNTLSNCSNYRFWVTTAICVSNDCLLRFLHV